MNVNTMSNDLFSVLQSVREYSRVNAIDGSLSAFTTELGAESQMPKRELLFAEVAKVFLESRV